MRRGARPDLIRQATRWVAAPGRLIRTSTIARGRSCHRPSRVVATRPRRTASFRERRGQPLKATFYNSAGGAGV